MTPEIYSIDDLELEPLSEKEKQIWRNIEKSKDSKIGEYIRQRNIAAGKAMIAANNMVIG